MSVAGTAVLVLGPVLLGALTQRATGLGLALVGAPFLVAILGPRDGVSFGNALQVLLCAVVLARTWRGVDLRSAGLLLSPAPSSRFRSAPGWSACCPRGRCSSWSVCSPSGRSWSRSSRASGAGCPAPPGAVGAGAVAGFVNAAAGVGGPMISAFALARRWSTDVFVPTAQLVLLVINLLALLGKGVPRLAPRSGAPASWRWP